MINTVYSYWATTTILPSVAEKSRRARTKKIPSPGMFPFDPWHPRQVSSPCRPAFSGRPTWREAQKTPFIARPFSSERPLRPQGRAHFSPPGWFCGSPWPPYFPALGYSRVALFRSPMAISSRLCQTCNPTKTFPYFASNYSGRWRYLSASF